VPKRKYRRYLLTDSTGTRACVWLCCCAEIGDHAAVLAQRYRALWDLERVLYQRFRYSDSGAAGAADDMTLNQLQEQAGASYIHAHMQKSIHTHMQTHISFDDSRAHTRTHTHTHTHTHKYTHTHERLSSKGRHDKMFVISYVWICKMICDTSTTKIGDMTSRQLRNWDQICRHLKIWMTSCRIHIYVCRITHEWVMSHTQEHRCQISSPRQLSRQSPRHLTHSLWCVSTWTFCAIPPSIKAARCIFVFVFVLICVYIYIYTYIHTRVLVKCMCRCLFKCMYMYPHSHAFVLNILRNSSFNLSR